MCGRSTGVAKASKAKTAAHLGQQHTALICTLVVRITCSRGLGSQPGLIEGMSLCPASLALSHVAASGSAMPVAKGMPASRLGFFCTT